MAGKTTIYHHLQMIYGKGFTDLERRRAQGTAIYGLVDVFKRARLQYRDLIPLEDVEVRSQIDMPILPESLKWTTLTQPAF